MTDMVVGVLALQGDFEKHCEMLKSLKVTVRDVRRPSQLEECHGLIIPGGESTVMMKQMEFINFKASLIEFAQRKPVFGTCAGLIVIAQEIICSPMQPLGLIDVVIERNAFGTQVNSFSTEIQVQLEHSKTLPAIFIRAPRIRQCQADVKILASYQNEAVLVRQGRHLGATFHPELTVDDSIHRFFLNMISTSRSI